MGVPQALYLVSGRMAIDPKMPSWIWPLMGLYAVLAVFMNREFLGRDLMCLLDSHEVKTEVVLLLMGLILAWRTWAPLPDQEGLIPLRSHPAKVEANNNE